MIISPLLIVIFPIYLDKYLFTLNFSSRRLLAAISPDNLFPDSLRAREMTEVREPKKSISMGQVTGTCNCSFPTELVSWGSNRGKTTLSLGHYPKIVLPPPSPHPFWRLCAWLKQHFLKTFVMCFNPSPAFFRRP